MATAMLDVSGLISELLLTPFNLKIATSPCYRPKLSYRSVSLRRSPRFSQNLTSRLKVDTTQGRQAYSIRCCVFSGLFGAQHAQGMTTIPHLVGPISSCKHNRYCSQYPISEKGQCVCQTCVQRQSKRI